MLRVCVGLNTDSRGARVSRRGGEYCFHLELCPIYLARRLPTRERIGKAVASARDLRRVQGQWVWLAGES